MLEQSDATDLDREARELAEAITMHLNRSRGSVLQSASVHDLHVAVSLAVRDRVVDRWRATTQAHWKANPRFVYYLSAEYLLGQQLSRNLLATGLTSLLGRALEAAGVDPESIHALDPEPGLGNGGLGRLAACYLESAATLDLPVVGYGIRYEHGIFRQRIVEGRQVECPDDWLLYGFPWEFPQPDDMVEVGLYGRTEHTTDADGRLTVRWHPGEKVMGEPCHVLVPGYGTRTVGMLRLWRARPTVSFDFELFDSGDYLRAVSQKVQAETISKVLYPNDESPAGQELRLKQQYFFVACSIRDIIRRFRLRNDDWSSFPDKVVIQLNDTHPVVAIPELMRVLLDEEGIGWDRAWEITSKVFAYTCHTLLPEALERWPVDLLQRLLPRHMEIVFEINQRFLDEVRAAGRSDADALRELSIIEEGSQQQVRMSNLATVGSFAVNGVAELQTRLLRERTLERFAERWPNRFLSVTNGVSPRRFVAIANPRLCALITDTIGDGWLRDLERLRELEDHLEDGAFRQRWRQVKGENKRLLVDRLARMQGVSLDPDSLFDVHVKRIHEYKRQLLKVLELIAQYHRLLDDPDHPMVPRTVVFGGKAAPGYRMAKQIIRLIHDVAAALAAEPKVADRLRIAFVENFNVTEAERIYPAADLSEQISQAGMEASGTGNMKFALNGAVTIGTLDGANIEIRERTGDDAFFAFGMTVDEVQARASSGETPADRLEADAELRRAVDAIARGRFSPDDPDRHRGIVDALWQRDPFFVLADFRSYIDCCDRVGEAYRDIDSWARRSVLAASRCGWFSSDRAIASYRDRIWHVEPVAVPSEE